VSIGFCEECGKPIHAGDAFCQGCGHALAGPSCTAKEFANASGESWFTGGFREGKAAKPLPAELHVQLWVTNSSQLTQQMGAADAGVVLDMLRGRAGKSGRNIGLLLDLAGDIGAGKVDWKEHVAVLRKVDQTLRETSGRSWDALCLVGDDKVLPMAILEDPTESDPQVETDACYASCSTANPWTEEAARFFWWAVGRLPVGKNWGVHPLANYFKNRDAAVSQAVSRGMPYGLSARCWEKASQAALPVCREIICWSSGVQTFPNANRGRVEQRFGTVPSRCSPSFLKIRP